MAEANIKATVNHPTNETILLFLCSPMIFLLELIFTIKKRIKGETIPFKIAEYIKALIGLTPEKFKIIPIKTETIITR